MHYYHFIPINSNVPAPWGFQGFDGVYVVKSSGG